MKLNKLILIPALAVISLAACKREKLDEFPGIPSEGHVVSAGDVDAAGITKDNEYVRVPVKVKLSGPAAKAFQVDMTISSDTINQLINNHVLQNTVIAPNGAVEYPNVVNFNYGTDSAVVMVSFKLSTLEFNYGKNVAISFRLTDPTKNNTVSLQKSTVLIVLNTSELINFDDIHYLSIVNGGGTILTVEHGKNYEVNSEGINIPLNIDLAGVAGRTFTVKTATDLDTLNKLIANHTFPDNTIILPKQDYSVDSIVTFASNSNSAKLSVGIPWSVFDASETTGKNFALVVKLTDPTKHVLHPVKSTVIILVEPSVNLDNNSYITGDGTGLRAEYFQGTQELDADGRAPTKVRIEDINFSGDWDDPWRGYDNFSVRWKGQFLAPVRGDYIFYQTRWDDGARLYVNGQAIIDDFTAEWNKPSRFGKIHLERGQRYTIEAHHRENVGGQQAVLEFEVPSAGVSRRVVPKAQLYPAQ